MFRNRAGYLKNLFNWLSNVKAFTDHTRTSNCTHHTLNFNLWYVRIIPWEVQLLLRDSRQWSWLLRTGWTCWDPDQSSCWSCRRLIRGWRCRGLGWWYRTATRRRTRFWLRMTGME